MRYIAAYLLLKIAGNESPTAADVTKVIQSVGIEVEKARLDSLISELDGKDINAVRVFYPPMLRQSTYHSIAHSRGH